ncbi:hypothetical protein PVAP13_1NG016700 [Panicum virgatum]|uniref:Uncharacterized protein n=1 Tax=Panicum virgatum TaxID=38727 RepID=A0A8T0WLT7_PANVG|nr:hypothetical protein PVAP13_1NG016700 [Panicum virgatum]
MREGRRPVWSAAEELRSGRLPRTRSARPARRSARWPSFAPDVDALDNRGSSVTAAGPRAADRSSQRSPSSPPHTLFLRRNPSCGRIDLDSSPTADPLTGPETPDPPPPPPPPNAASPTIRFTLIRSIQIPLHCAAKYLHRPARSGGDLTLPRANVEGW